MFNPEQFKALLIKAIGNRTLTEFANESNVNRTYISKYINLKLQRPPAPDIIKRIADKAINGVTYDALMVACGYLNNNQSNTFIKENVSLIRGNMTFEEMSKDIADKFNTPEYRNLYSADYIKNVESGKITPTYQRINLLAIYAEVKEEFFYMYNTQEDLKEAREEYKILKDIERVDNLYKSIEELSKEVDINNIKRFFTMMNDKNVIVDFKKFILCPDNIKYFEFAKRLKEKGINPDDVIGFSLKY